MKYLLLGVLTLLLCMVFFAPASLIKKGLESNTELTVTDVRGSLWNGSALLSVPGKVQQIEVGRLGWKFATQGLFSLCFTYNIEIRAQSHSFTGQVCRAYDSIVLEGELELHANLLNRLLINYDIQVSGSLKLDAIYIELGADLAFASEIPEIKDLSAQIRWPGGPIQYRLSGLNYALNLPAMQGELGHENGAPTLRVFEQNDTAQTPLLSGSLDKKGWISIGITKKFTKLLNQPWPGSEPDHAVVLEVQEKLL